MSSASTPAASGTDVPARPQPRGAVPDAARDTVMNLRNVAIIAHVDHGKTSLTDQLLLQSGNFRAGELSKLAGGQHGLIMDSNPLERERGITILSKNCAVQYHALDGIDYRINIVDTPGHADFGGEVERVLRLADGCLLLCDAFEGPMPQTRFVLGKAIEAGLRPTLVVNKCDRPDGDPQRVQSQFFDLLVELGADEHALEFTTVYTSAKQGWAVDTWAGEAPASGDMRAVFEAIVRNVPHPEAYPEKPLRMQVTTLDYSEYLGRIGIGRVHSGAVMSGQAVALVKHTAGQERGAAPVVVRGRIAKLMGFEGLGRVERERIDAGDLCAVTGLEGIDIGDTICDPDHPEALDPLTVDEPTITMTFRINDSPFAGQDGEYVTTRQIRARLERELEHNVALRVVPGQTADEFRVSGRGILHLGILIETMRREGYELSIGRPEVITRAIDGVLHEPLEELVIDCPAGAVGPVMQLVGERRGLLQRMDDLGPSTQRLVFEMPSRSLIGLRGRVLTASQGEAVMTHSFIRFEPVNGERLRRPSGVMIATETGQVTGFAVENLHDRGVLFVRPGDQVYAGQVVGEHNRDNDLTVNIVKVKKLDNMRAANKDATVTLKAPRVMSLEQCIEYIEDDELVEITPKSVRVRKKVLDEGARRRTERQAKDKGL